MVIPDHLREHYDTVNGIFVSEGNTIKIYYNLVSFPAQLEEHMNMADGRIVPGPEVD